jgi:hypothetical protein
VGVGFGSMSLSAHAEEEPSLVDYQSGHSAACQEWMKWTNDSEISSGDENSGAIEWISGIGQYLIYEEDALSRPMIWFRELMLKVATIVDIGCGLEIVQGS